MSSLCNKMWEDSLSIAEQAFQTNFIQGILSGTLDPNIYCKWGYMHVSLGLDEDIKII